MGHQTRPAPRPPRPNRTGQTDDTASAGESPAAKNTLRARRAADLASCQPGLDADQISLYRHHQCLRALQRGTLRARQDFGGVPRTHQFLITLMVHTTKLKPAGHATDHIGKINDEWPPRDSHPERRSTRAISNASSTMVVRMCDATRQPTIIGSAAPIGDI
jgi:hypothetical protein